MVNSNLKTCGHHLRSMVIGLAALVVLSAAGHGQGSVATPLKKHLVGTWKSVSVTNSGAKSLPFGENPKGMLILTAGGHFAQVNVANNIPKFASNNRTSGTAAENMSVVQNSLAFFGTYTVDEIARTITYKIEASTYPGWNGLIQTRKILLLTADEFLNENGGASSEGVSQSKFRREGK